MSLRPLIAIYGTTGVGKSKLAIELALALAERERGGGYRGARIINADAMQVYAGLDILTNKVPVEEQRGVEHLLMGFKRPSEQYVVGEWVKDAMRAIDETHQRKQIPIVVGGTAYWIQHLLFPGRLATGDEPDTPSGPASVQSPKLAEAIAQLPPDLLSDYHNLPTNANSSDFTDSFRLHRLLSALDPPVAQRWHWKDTRKILRSLEIIKSTGRLSSEMISEQSRTALRPRYRTLCFWLYARPEVLFTRLDDRVDQMLEQGLLQEVTRLMNSSRCPRRPSLSSGKELKVALRRGPTPAPSTDYTFGLYQSIGYREFSTYLALPPDVDTFQRERAFAAAVERMKVSTRQYAKRQVGWIRNKMLPVVREVNKTSREAEVSVGDVVPTFLLDASELGDRWHTDVQEAAVRITEDFLEHRPLPDPMSTSETAREMLTVDDKPTAPEAVLKARQLRVCPTCTADKSKPVMIEQKQWLPHMQSKKHRLLAARRKEQGRSSPSDHHPAQAEAADRDAPA